MDTTHLTIELPLDELIDSAAVAARFVDPDERVESGNVWLIAADGHRTWRAAGSAVAVDLRGGDDSGYYEVVVPVRLVHAAELVAGGADTVTLATGTNAARPAAELRGPGGVVTVATHPGATPEPIAPLDDELTAATARVDIATLRDVVAVARQIPFGFDQRTMAWPAMTMSVSGPALELTVEWPSFGIAHHAVPATTTGAGDAAFMPGPLAALLDSSPEGDVCVTLPKPPGDPIEISTDRWIGLVEAVDLDGDWPAEAEELLSEAFGPDAASDDGRGNYVLATEPYISARFSDQPPWRLEMTSVVLVGVEPSAELLAELNDHNRNLGLARVAMHGGNVVMQADLLVKSLDVAELRTTARWIAEHTIRLAPVLAAVFGGVDPNRHAEESPR